MENSINHKKPTGAKRLILKLGILFFKLKLDYLLGNKLLLLIHKGRITGREHKTPLEPIKFTEDEIYVVSGFGKQSDWFNNIRENPMVVVRIGGKLYDASASVLDKEKAKNILMNYFEKNSISGCLVAKIFYGLRCKKEDYKKLAKSVPVVKFKLTKRKKTASKKEGELSKK